jgi:hypothetical protein
LNPATNSASSSYLKYIQKFRGTSNSHHQQENERKPSGSSKQEVLKHQVALQESKL